MSRILLAFRVFFLVLFKAETAEQVRRALDGEASSTGGEAAIPTAPASTKPQAKPPAKPGPTSKTPPAPPPAPPRSDALILLATLQREARFLDFIKEPLDAYSDEQVGAAARDVHRGCGTVIERLFSPEPLVEGEEGTQIEVPEGFDAGCYHLTGNVTDAAQPRGELVHHGWRASKVDVPKWTGSNEAAKVIAPAEISIP